MSEEKKLTKTGSSISFKWQTKKYEPMEIAQWAETSVYPDETNKEAEDRVWDFLSERLVERIKEAREELSED